MPKLRDEDFKAMKLTRAARDELERIRKQSGSGLGRNEPITGDELTELLRRPRRTH